MSSRLAAIAAVLTITIGASACAASSSDDSVESGEDAFTSGVPVRISHEFAPLNLELSKDYPLLSHARDTLRNGHARTQ
jgi:hypothetical protein